MIKTLAFFFCAVAPMLAAEGTMTPAERAYLVEQLEQSKKEVLASLEGVTASQWKFKAGPERWSVQETAEHIVLSEGFIFQGSQQILKTPAAARLATATAEVDRKIVAGIQDRSKKASAPEPLKPGAKFATPAEAAREFTAARDKTIAYVKSTNDDLRAHSGNGPTGPMDAYQFLLLLSSHSQRHTAQILEVKAAPGYPKGSE